MNVSKFRPVKNREILCLARSCVFCVAVFGFMFLPDSAGQASEPLRLTLDGELVIGEPFDPLGPALDELLGLESGDPISLIFDFDSSVQLAPGLPGEPQFGALVLDRFEAQIGGLNFLDVNPSLTFSVDASVGEIGNSGIDFSALLFGIRETNQTDIFFGPLTAVPFLINFQTGDIGVNGLSRFPIGLSGDDIASFSSGTLGLTQAGLGSSNFLTIDLTDVTVSSIPEPSCTTLMVFSLFTMATGRRRQ